MKMGIFKSEITLRNPIHPELKSLKVSALVDTGALHLCLPQHIALQLQLKELEKREVTLANGRKQLAAYVGPLEVSFGKRHCFVGAMVLGDEPLLGAIPLEDMDLVVDPARRRLLVNPENPNIPRTLAKTGVSTCLLP
jgi:clan AA aspartic protease